MEPIPVLIRSEGIMGVVLSFEPLPRMNIATSQPQLVMHAICMVTVPAKVQDEEGKVVEVEDKVMSEWRVKPLGDLQPLVVWAPGPAVEEQLDGAEEADGETAAGAGEEAPPTDPPVA